MTRQKRRAAGSGYLKEAPTLSERLSGEWQKVHLGDLLREVDVRVGSLSKEEAAALEVLSLTKNQGLIPQTERFGKRIATEDVRNYKLVREGWIVYNPYVIWEGAVHALRKRKSGMVSPVYPVWETTENDSGFLDFLLRTPPLIESYNRFCSGAVNRRRSIRKEAFAGVEVSVPPIAERRSIACVLRTVQHAKEATKKVIAATKELKKSLMRHLFTYGPVPVDRADQVKLKETEVGMIPRHWTVTKLGELARIGNGSTPKRTNQAYWKGGTISWLTSAKIHESVILQANEFVTELAVRECHLPLVRKNSLVVAITGQGKTLGNTALVTFDTRVSQHLAYVQFQTGDVIPEFMLMFLQSRYEPLRQISQSGGSTKGALTCGFLKGYSVPVPPVDEQRCVADPLAAVTRKLAVEEIKHSALESLFHSLLHHLMTGKVRLPEFAGAA